MGKELTFEYVPLSFISSPKEIERQALNTLTFHAVREEYGELKALGDLLSSTQYGYTASAGQNGSARFLRITDINNGSVNWDTTPYCNCDRVDQYRLRPKDILISIIRLNPPAFSRSALAMIL